MTKNEYTEKIIAINQKFNQERRDIDEKYALSNSEVKIGDIVTDHYTSIIVQKIGVSNPFFRDVPSCNYIGQRYTLSGKPYKKDTTWRIMQANLKKLNGKPIKNP